MHPLLILGTGIATVILLIAVFRVHAFIALIVSALLVSFLAPGDASDKVERVATAFGESAGKIGLVIAFASVIGICMMESGAADRIVRSFIRVLGEKRSGVALTGSGYVLAMPVFFDTVFYLLVPLARSLYRRTGRNYLLYLLAIAAGGAITHTLVPPTPGPLVIAAQLNVDLGVMIVTGMVVSVPAAIAGLAFASWRNRKSPIPMRDIPGVPPPEPIPDDRLPPLWLSVLPIVLPVLLIALNTVVSALAREAVHAQALAGVTGYAAVSPPLEDPGRTRWESILPYTSQIGNPNFALLLSAAAAVYVYYRQRRPSRERVAGMIETALMSGGVIILITAAGGAFGAMLKQAGIGDAIKSAFAGGSAGGLTFLGLGFGIAAVLKVAQGSSTVAMITAASMLGAMISPGESLGYHPVYLALVIGSGSLIGSWMNDSGFWIFAKMGGLTEVETLRTWTPLLCVLGGTSMVTTVVLAVLLPFPLGR